MTDFEIRRQCRELRTYREPAHDLWAGIAKRIAIKPPSRAPSARHFRVALAMAASVAFAIGISLSLLPLNPGSPDRFAPYATEFVAHEQNLPSTPVASFANQTSIDRQRFDPRFAGTAIVLDAADAELRQALQQKPNAAFLIGLINRTHEQRMKLTQQINATG